MIWEKESKNFYYATGPLLRMEIGDKIVQAEDYAYTAQGWIKGMNAGSISASRDIGLDSYSEYISGINAQNRDVALDAAGFVLGYYDGDATTKDDYWSPAFAGQSVSQRFVPDVTSSATQADYKSLYNGNIAYMVTALTDISQAPLDNQLTAYRYDQLNRIKQVRAHRNFSTTGTYANTFNGSTGDDGKYHEDFSYDRNGNILSVLRNGNNTGTTQVMDNFTYHYYDNTGSIITYSGGMPLNATNKLAYVGDAAGATNYTTDIDNQTTTTNYTYDDIGNLISDVSEEIYDIDWYANGKIHSIRRTATSTKSDLEFIYDAGGNRIVKIVKPRDGSGEMSQLHWTYTYYVRDAQGNVLAVYERTYAASDYGSGYYDDKYKLTELDIYSSKRLGVLYADTMQFSTFNDASFTDTHGNTFTEGFGFSSTPVTCHSSSCVIPHKRTLGHKAYEVTNHLGNVLETVSDRKLPYDSYSYTAWSSGTKYAYDAVRNSYYQSTSGTYQRDLLLSPDNKADYYLADVRSYSDYYAFGSPMPGRNYSSASYRYGFNGKEKLDEMHGNTGDAYDYGVRIHDARLGIFLGVDPKSGQYASWSPYQFAHDSPIVYPDNGYGPPGSNRPNQSGYCARNSDRSTSTSSYREPAPTAYTYSWSPSPQPTTTSTSSSASGGAAKASTLTTPQATYSSLTPSSANTPSMITNREEKLFQGTAYPTPSALTVNSKPNALASTLAIGSLGIIDMGYGLWEGNYDHLNYITTRGIMKPIFTANGSVRSAQAQKALNWSNGVKAGGLFLNIVNTTAGGMQIYDQYQHGGINKVNPADATSFGLGAIGTTANAFKFIGLGGTWAAPVAEFTGLGGIFVTTYQEWYFIYKPMDDLRFCTPPPPLDQSGQLMIDYYEYLPGEDPKTWY